MTQASDIERILRDWGGRPSVAVIDLDQLRTNIGELRRMTGDGVRLMAVVKADGYGHGSIPVAKAALRSGADELAVATVEEGVRLRASGVRAPILVLGPIGERERRRAISHDLMLVVASTDLARKLSADVRASGRKQPLDVHVKIDSGMHRYGVEPDGAVDVARVIDGANELRLAGVMTHFACADDPDPASTREQARVFDVVVGAIRQAGIEVPTEHLANSAATMRFPEFHRDRVRVGIALYGLQPDAGMPLPPPMRPIMTVHSRLARVVSLEAGDRVSYGGTWAAEAATRVGLVPIGYADGYRRQGSNLAWMDVSGERAPVRGRICMDQTLVEVGP
ncbi:MAG TPA: alanine racemase, partial [Thermomicrobiales bacterium]|nr:alanine racemase [Thermomicrobiales bacterium]